MSYRTSIMVQDTQLDSPCTIKHYYQGTDSMTEIVKGWRDRKRTVSAVTVLQNTIEPILHEYSKDIRLWIAGGAVRDLVYKIRSRCQKKPKDIDFFVTGMPSDKEARVEIFNRIIDVTKGKQSTYALAPLTPDNDRILVLGVRILDDIGFEIIEGRENIEATVAAFDWYECAWYLPSLDSMIAHRPSPEYIAEKVGLDYMPKPHANSLTLLKYHHAAKTLSRGFKFANRHGFWMKAIDAQVLSTEVRLQEEKYGEYIFA